MVQKLKQPLQKTALTFYRVMQAIKELNQNVSMLDHVQMQQIMMSGFGPVFLKRKRKDVSSKLDIWARLILQLKFASPPFGILSLGVLFIQDKFTLDFSLKILTHRVVSPEIFNGVTPQFLNLLILDGSLEQAIN